MLLHSALHCNRGILVRPSMRLRLALWLLPGARLATLARIFRLLRRARLFCARYMARTFASCAAPLRFWRCFCTGVDALLHAVLQHFAFWRAYASRAFALSSLRAAVFRGRCAYYCWRLYCWLP